MGSDSYFMVFFHGATTIDDAERALRATSLMVTRDGDQLAARRGTGPELSLGLSTEEHVILEAEGVAEDHDVPGLASCDHRFEVGFDDLEAVLDDTNTLFEVGAALQDLTNGYILYAWNGNLIVPGGDPCACPDCA
ncbi:MAG: hypothetical protein JNL83_13650 [Myxococcales bacterium]|nr:hypothetical protein [Myxococcales bacterium]